MHARIVYIYIDTRYIYIYMCIHYIRIYDYKHTRVHACVHDRTKLHICITRVYVHACIFIYIYIHVLNCLLW